MNFLKHSWFRKPCYIALNKALISFFRWTSILFMFFSVSFTRLSFSYKYSMMQTFAQLHIALKLLLLGFKLFTQQCWFGASFALNPSSNFSVPSFVDTVMLWKRDRRTSNRKRCLKRLTCGVPLVSKPNQKMMTLPCHSSSISTNGSKNELLGLFHVLLFTGPIWYFDAPKTFI